MSIHDELMLAGGADSIMEAMADRGVAVYVPTTESGLNPFTFDANLSLERGAEEWDGRDLLKLKRMDLVCRTAQLVDGGIGDVQRQATVIVNNAEWAIDPARSSWGPALVKLGLRRAEVSRLEEMERHVAV